MISSNKQFNNNSVGIPPSLNFDIAKRVIEKKLIKFRLRADPEKQGDVTTASQKLYANVSAGFSLVEMLVSLSIFTIVVTMSVGTLLILINANGIAQGMQLVMTNLSFTMDSMTREVRTATDWYCGTYNGGTQPGVPTDVGNDPAATRDCADGNYLSVVESGDSLTDGLSTGRITYYFDDDYHGVGHGAILRKLGTTNGDGPWVPLTGTDVAIDTMKFVVTDTERYVHGATNERQPTATIYLKGRAGFDSVNTPSVRVKVFDIQTSIAQRLLDI